MLKSTRNRLMAILLTLILIGSLLSYRLSTSTVFLLTIAQGTDIPSSIHYLAIERLYKLCETPNIRNAFLDDFRYDKYPNLRNMYIIVSGFLGDITATDYVVRELVAAMNNNNYSTIHYAIDSLGMLGDDNAEPLLRTLLEKYDSYHLRVPKYLLKRSIFLMTGNIPEYGSKDNDTPRFGLTDELVHARKIIAASKDRYRTLEEMITLDKTLRRPGW